jgi:hypothetical protein
MTTMDARNRPALGTLHHQPIVAVPFSNPAHLAHPAFRRSLRDLSGAHFVLQLAGERFG